MREIETIKECSDKLVSIANKVIMLGSSLVDSRIVQKNPYGREMFFLNPMQEEKSTFLAKESTIMLWHKRLRHCHH
ncbi:hypothetical protein GQ457_04G016740 [Hibiscus cannabinus]